MNDEENDNLDNNGNQQQDFSLEDIQKIIDINEEDAIISDEDADVDDDQNERSESSDDEELRKISRCYRHHKASVFSICIEPVNRQLAVSGGEDDIACIWSLESGQVVFECKGHKDSVICTEFSCDGKYLATGDMSGIIKVWDMPRQTEILSYECSDIEWMNWHNNYPVLLAGAIDGNVWMWQVPSGLCKMYQGHGSKATCGKFLLDGNRACVGYEDGSILVWDLKTSTVVHRLSGSIGHSDSVTSIDCYFDGVLIATSSVDGTAKIVNTSNGKVIFTVTAPGHQDDHVDNIKDNFSIEAVSFSKLQPLLASGSLNGDLIIWDLRNQRLRHHCRHQGGITKLLWDPTQPLIYTGGLDGNVLVWNALSGECCAMWHGHHDEILDLVITRNGEQLLSCSSDCTMRLYKLK